MRFLLRAHTAQYREHEMALGVAIGYRKFGKIRRASLFIALLFWSIQVFFSCVDMGQGVKFIIVKNKNET